MRAQRSLVGDCRREPIVLHYDLHRSSDCCRRRHTAPALPPQLGPCNRPLPRWAPNSHHGLLSLVPPLPNNLHVHQAYAFELEVKETEDAVKHVDRTLAAPIVASIAQLLRKRAPVAWGNRDRVEEYLDLVAGLDTSALRGLLASPCFTSPARSEAWLKRRSVSATRRACRLARDALPNFGTPGPKNLFGSLFRFKSTAR
eukprot:79377-Amphidinium_carterae.1